MPYSIGRLALFAALPVVFGFVGIVNGPPANPPVVPGHSIEAVTNMPPRVRDMLTRACFDCHSQTTKWPWYASIPGVSYMIRKDVRQGRATLNFSEWTTGPGRHPAVGAAMLTATCAAVEQHLMPKKPYPYFHPEARLTTDDIASYCNWTREQATALRATARRRQ
jgi:hypothetical protein